MMSDAFLVVKKINAIFECSQPQIQCLARMYQIQSITRVQNDILTRAKCDILPFHKKTAIIAYKRNK